VAVVHFVTPSLLKTMDFIWFHYIMNGEKRGAPLRGAPGSEGSKGSEGSEGSEGDGGG